MYKTVLSFFILAATMKCWAEYQNNTNNQSFGQYCEPHLEKLRGEREKKERTKEPEAKELDSCEKYSIAAAINGEALSARDERPTVDRKIICRMNGGYSLDFDDCVRVSKAYNAVIVAEQAMIATQSLRVAETNATQAKEVAQRQSQGDGQNAALEAAKERSQFNAQLYKEQFGVYSTAVSALGAQLARWQGKGPKAIKKACEKGKGASKAKDVVNTQTGITNYDEKMCASTLDDISSSILVFVNDDARSRFLSESAGFINKALVARRNAGLSENIANEISKTPGIKDDNNTVFDPCLTSANLPECRTDGPRSPTTASFQGAEMQFGAGGGNQAFDFNPSAGNNNLNQDDPTATGASAEKVSDISSQFESAAKAATGILNPAGEASISGGSQSSAPGGGGGGGGGGGSSALSDDLEGADSGESKEPEIKATKVAGKYAASAGGGFQGIKKGKEDANPFSSLFDSKSEGGIEEDRSIASGDIDDSASGLFEKISKRYGQVQQDKRVESQNLE
jgi:hypothetical protein